MARFILNKQKLEEQYNLIKQISDKVSYSYKTNPIVGHILEDTTDCDFSVHSIESIKQIKDKKRIWFFPQGWTQEQFNEIINLGVDKFVIDNEFDLELLKNIENQITLLLRMKLMEYTLHTGKHFVYGMPCDKVNKLILELKENPNLTLGIHFHRKTQNVSEWSLKREITESLTEDTLKSIKILNIGGGLPIEYKNSKGDQENIFNKIIELKNFVNEYNILLYTEPGRFVAAPCVELETEIKLIYDNNIIVDCSIFNAAIDSFIAHIRLEIEGELSSGTAYTIKGCSPDSADILRYKVYLSNPKVGDKIVFLNAGAYNFNCDFCNLPKLHTE